MKFKAMVDEKFMDNKVEPFEIIGYLSCEDSEDFTIRREGETCEWRIDPSTLEIVKEKRKPDSNGVLPLTESELREFAIINKTTPNVTLYLSGGQIYCKYNGDFDFSVYRYKTILWLAERFELNGGIE